MTSLRVFSAGKWRDEGSFCWLLEQPDYYPWFMSHVERWAELSSWIPTPMDVSIRMKWILLEKGLGATAYLVDNKGYRPPTMEEGAEALRRAVRELVASVYSHRSQKK